MTRFLVVAVLGLGVPFPQVPAAHASEPAGALAITVEPRVPVPGPPRSRPPPRTLPSGLGGGIEVDGRLEEPPWAAVPWAPPVEPFVDVLAPPEVRLKVLRIPEGLAFAVDGLPEGASTGILVNPDGLETRWWTVTLAGERAVWEVCDFGGRTFAFERAVLPRAAVCREVEGGFPAARSGEVWEVLFPWSELTPPTELIRVDWRVIGPGRRGGGWSPRDRELSPHGGLALVPSSQARLGLTPHPDQGRFEARAVVPHPGAAGVEPGSWTWRLVYRDRVLEEGTVDVARAADGSLVGRFGGSLPLLFRLGLVVVAPGGDPFPAAAARWFSVQHHATLATPIFTDTLRIAYRVSAPQEDLRVSVTDRAGAPLGAGVVDLPTGEGTLRITARPAWPDEVRVQVGERLLDAPAFRAAGVH